MSKSVMKSAWFWCLIAALVLILTALFISSGMKTVNGLAWTFFVLALIVATVGIILAILEWIKKPHYVKEYNNLTNTYTTQLKNSREYAPVENRNPYIIPHLIPSNNGSFVTSNIGINSISPINVDANVNANRDANREMASPFSMNANSGNTINSPRVMPSGNINMPQSEKGFTATGSRLSDLAFEI